MVAPCVSKMPSTVVGKICKLVADSTNNITIGVVARVISGVDIFSIAVIAAGVAALPAPIMFADMFVASNELTSAVCFPNKTVITGDITRPSASMSPASTATCITPIHTMYIPARVIASITPDELAPNAVDNTNPGAVIVSFTKLATTIMKNSSAITIKMTSDK